MDQPSIDRRKFERLKTHIPITYKNLKSTSSRAMSVHAKDLCEGGFCFVGHEFLSLGNRLAVSISMPTCPREVKVISTVSWVKKLSYGQEYEVGNKFFKISDRDRQEVARYVKVVSGTDIGI